MMGRSFDLAIEISEEAIFLLREAILIRRLLSVASLSPSEMVSIFKVSSEKEVFEIKIIKRVRRNF